MIGLLSLLPATYPPTHPHHYLLYRLVQQEWALPPEGLSRLPEGPSRRQWLDACSHAEHGGPQEPCLPHKPSCPSRAPSRRVHKGCRLGPRFKEAKLVARLELSHMWTLEVPAAPALIG